MFGLSSSRPVGLDALGDHLETVALPDDALVKDAGEIEHSLELVGDHLADGNSRPVGDDRGDRLLVDVGVNHPLFWVDLAELVHLGRAGSCRRGCCCFGLGVQRGRRLGGERRRRLGDHGRLRDRLAQREHFLDQRALLSPVCLERGELLAALDELRVDLSDAVLVGGAEVAFTRKRVLLAFEGDDFDFRVLNRGRLRVLADGHARASRVEQAHRLVGQLPRRDVAVRQIDGGDDRLVGDAHLVVLLHRTDQPAQHDRCGRDIRLADHDRLEAPGQRRVLLNILPVLRPRRRGDGAQRSARERWLQQIGRVARSGLSAGPDQRMRLVDEEDDRRRRGLHLVDDRPEPLLELALHRRARLHEADVENAELDPFERRRNVARRDALREAFDDSRLADARFASQDRIVLPPTHEHVDDLADFVVAAEDGVHLSPLSLGCEILAEPVERGRAFGAGRSGRAFGARRGDARTVHRAEVAFVGSGPDRALARGHLIDRKLRELLRDADQRASQLDGLQDPDQEMPGADLRLAKQERRIVPAAVERVRDLVRDARHLGFVLAEAVDHCGRIRQHFGAVQLEMIGGEREIRAILLQDMHEPMGKLEVAISRALGLA